ncbi:type II toxin-antitoxin system VapB family antitoxin [Microbacterium sp.]|uniref:type II toxin-antitoxin system VapB family antitoxin n=1 Tax=Microbacterium sp. TaxID=51671 RepID=UPI0039E52C3A
MGLNIKNERTVALVDELAALTGVNKTSAIEQAVRARLDQLAADGVRTREVDRRRRAADLVRDIRHDIEGVEGSWRDFERHELYDERGVPR